MHHPLGDVVDLFLGIEPAEPETNGRVRQLVANAEGLDRKSVV